MMRRPPFFIPYKNENRTCFITSCIDQLERLKIVTSLKSLKILERQSDTSRNI